MWKIWWLRGLGKEGGRKQIKWKGYENRIEDRERRRGEVRARKS